MSKNRVYLAGKISKNDWRHDIFLGLRNAELSFEKGNINPPTPKDGFEYSGPFFLACDHGCYHGDNTHGRGASNDGCGDDGDKPTTVLKKCLYWLNQSDFVFAWIDSEDAYGTIAEIGYAKAMGKPIFLAFNKTFQQSNFFRDTWFIQKMADDVIFSNSSKDAWDKSVKRYQSGENSRSVRPASIKQIEYVKSLLKKHKKSISIPFDEITMDQAGNLISHLNHGTELTDEMKDLLITD